MAETKVRVAREGQVGRLTLDRPERLNAFDAEMLDQFVAAAEAVRDDRGLRVAVVTGAGERSFCAGADISEFRGKSVEDAYRLIGKVHRALNALEAAPVPVIAAINGLALGGGTEIALACDLRIAVASAQFGLPEITLGIFPGGGGTQRLPRLIGESRARELVLTGRRITADEALGIGFVHRVVPEADLEAAVDETVESMLAKPPLALAAVKRVMRHGADMSLAAALELELRSFASLFDSADVEEGAAAFAERRSPRFEGR